MKRNSERLEVGRGHFIVWKESRIPGKCDKNVGMKMCSRKKKKDCNKRLLVACLIGIGLLMSLDLMAQNGVDGIEKADQAVRKYFESGTKLMYAIGGVVGLIGAVKVYQKWNSGDQDTSKVAASWFGSCIFLIIVTTVIKSFFAI